MKNIWKNMDCTFRGNRVIRIVVACFCVLLVIALLSFSAYISLTSNIGPYEKAEKLLTLAPLIDGYNGLAYNIRMIAKNDLTKFNLSRNLSEVASWNLITDIPKLRRGKVGALFLAASAECLSQHKDAVVITLEQIDVIKRLIDLYPDFQLAKSSDDILSAVDNGKIGILISVDGGHSIQYSVAVLRNYYALGARSLSITSYCSNPWAESYQMDLSNRSKLNSFYGLSDFGKDVVWEMNRLGMLIDISHTSIAAMKEVLFESKAPVIFSRSAARAICSTEPNIPDDVMKLIRQKEGLLMVHFYHGYIKCDNSGSPATIQDVIKHLEYIREKATIDNIGIGSNFESFSGKIEGLEDTSKFPNLFAALVETGEWSDEDLLKIAGKNFLRVMREVERVRDELKIESPKQTWIKRSDLKKYNANLTCAATAIPDS